MILTRFIMNIFDTSTTNICIIRGVSSIFYFIYCRLYRTLYFVVFITTNQKFKLLLFIYRDRKWPKAVRRCEETVVKPNKKAMVSLTSS